MLQVVQIVCKSMQVLVSEFQSRNNGFQMGSLHFSNENILDYFLELDIFGINSG